MLFCLLVHWLALKMWFFTDDFAWLGLRLEVQSPSDLLHVLFAPQAQGTVRTLSERLFFLVFSSVFGLESPPFRVWVFLTQFANIVLLMQITRRITASPVAAFIAPFLWTASSGMALALAWSAAYNQIAWAFVTLLAFYLFLRYIDTGQRKYWIWQWMVFLLGFGVLELNVMYPALVSLYAFCCARPYFRKSLLLFLPSILFTIAHFTLVPPPTDPYYMMHFDAGILALLWHYWSYALGALRDLKTDWRPLWLGLLATLLLTAGLAAFVYQKVRARDPRVYFLLGWFLLALLPVLPLTNHFTEYYIIVPCIGLAILAAWAITSYKRSFVILTAAVLAALFLTVSIADTRVTGRYFYDRSRRMKYLIKGLEAQQKTQPTNTILLSGIDNDLFWTGFCDDPFRLIGIPHVFLAPGSEKKIEIHPEWGCDFKRFLLPLDDAITLLRDHQAKVYTLDRRNVVDVTQQYLESASKDFAEGHPEYVNVADPAYKKRLGPTWYPPEDGFCWMPKTATVRIRGPSREGQVLEAAGYCPAVLVKQGPLSVSFRIDGIAIGSEVVKQPDQAFNLRFALPPQLVGRPEVELQIEVSRTTQIANDERPLGLAFTTFTIK
jgi:hypothetical protein